MSPEDFASADQIDKWHKQLQDANPTRRLSAAGRLCRLGKLAVAAVPGLVGCLKDSNIHVRKMAALALGEIGEPVDTVVPALFDALSDPNAAVHRRAAVALMEIMTGSATALLLVQSRLSVAPAEMRPKLQAVLGLADDDQAAA
jgi:HEAT repeat protein